MFEAAKVVAMHSRKQTKEGANIVAMQGNGTGWDKGLHEVLSHLIGDLNSDVRANGESKAPSSSINAKEPG